MWLRAEGGYANGFLMENNYLRCRSMAICNIQLCIAYGIKVEKLIIKVIKFSRFIFVMGTLGQDRRMLMDWFFKGKKLFKMPVFGNLQYTTVFCIWHQS